MYLRQVREHIQFSIDIVRAQWSSSKTSEVEYGLLEALGIHIFSSHTSAETESLFFLT